jgi:hypothetical protein
MPNGHHREHDRNAGSKPTDGPVRNEFRYRRVAATRIVSLAVSNQLRTSSFDPKQAVDILRSGPSTDEIHRECREWREQLYFGVPV